MRGEGLDRRRAVDEARADDRVLAHGETRRQALQDLEGQMHRAVAHHPRRQCATKRLARSANGGFHA
jgi:hypothetical protein